MKIGTRVLSYILILTVLFSVLATAALAADESNVKQYGKQGGCLVFGDSTAQGVGSRDYYQAENTNVYRNMTGSFPYQVAKAVGCTFSEQYDKNGNYWPCCFPGQTLAATMDLLGVDDGYYDADYVHNKDVWGRYEWNLVGHFGESGDTGYICDLIPRASLIIVQLGMADIMYRPLILGTAADVTELVPLVLGELKTGFEYWVRAFPLFIDKLKEMNKTADIVIVGAYNPVADVELWDEALLPIGSAFTALSETMNAYYAQWAKEKNCRYVDISNVVSGATQFDMSLFGELLDLQGVGGHPTPDGHDYIYRQILAALPTQEETEPAAVTTDIKVDLTHIRAVDSVLLDGIPVCGYSVKDTVLTVPCRHKLAKTLTVNVKNEKGGTDFVTYLLTWHGDKGYTAFRLYEKIGAFPLTTKLAETVHASVKTVAAIVGKTAKSLFPFAK